MNDPDELLTYDDIISPHGRGVANYNDSFCDQGESEAKSILMDFRQGTSQHLRVRMGKRFPRFETSVIEMDEFESDTRTKERDPYGD